MPTKDDLKEVFVTGAIPTEKDFHDLIDVAGEPGEPGKPGDPGEKGDPFTYDDFTEEQLADLKGPQGDPGEPGRDAEPQFTEAEVAALKALVDDDA